MWRTVLCAAALSYVPATSVLAGDVAGNVSIVKKGAPVALRDAVVYLEGAKKAVPLQKAVIDQRDKIFSPHVLVVTRGTKVAFPNNDTVLHNVFAYYNAKKFDLLVYARGETKTQTFDKTGVVALLCNIHSEMSAYIIVVDTPYYAVSDKKGRYQIKDVAPGTYTLHVWHESGAQLTQSVTITGKDADLPLSLTK